MSDNDSRDLGYEPPNEALSSLPAEADPSRDLWPGIESRLDAAPAVEPRQGARGSSFLRPWLQAAAAIALFAAGAASGLGLGRTPESKLPASSMDEALALAAEVQRTGSEYVAALAAFTSVVDSLSSDVRGQGTSAAFATLYSAVGQLAALNASDPYQRSAEATVDRNELGSSERRVRF